MLSVLPGSLHSADAQEQQPPPLSRLRDGEVALATAQLLGEEKPRVELISGPFKHLHAHAPSYPDLKVDGTTVLYTAYRFDPEHRQSYHIYAYDLHAADKLFGLSKKAKGTAKDMANPVNNARKTGGDSWVDEAFAFGQSFIPAAGEIQNILVKGYEFELGERNQLVGMGMTPENLTVQDYTDLTGGLVRDTLGCVSTLIKIAPELARDFGLFSTEGLKPGLKKEIYDRLRWNLLEGPAMILESSERGLGEMFTRTYNMFADPTQVSMQAARDNRGPNYVVCLGAGMGNAVMDTWYWITGNPHGRRR